MRELTMNEMQIVSGAGDDCPSGNTYGGVNDISSVGDELIAFYEELIFATSYLIERIATSL